MPLPLIALAGLSLVPQLFKAGQGLSQLSKANKVQVQDTTPSAFREDLAMRRQEATTAQLPGLGLYQNQLAQASANAGGNALRSGASSSSILGSIAQADQRRQSGLLNLAVQSQQYQQNAKRALSQGLLQQAQYQQRDLDTANRTKAAFKQAGNTNLFSALEGAASTATYFGSNAGQNAVNGTVTGSYLNYDPSLLRGPYDSNPLLRMGMRGLS